MNKPCVFNFLMLFLDLTSIWDYFINNFKTSIVVNKLGTKTGINDSFNTTLKLHLKSCHFERRHLQQSNVHALTMNHVSEMLVAFHFLVPIILY